MSFRDLLLAAGSGEVPINSVSTNNIEYAFVNASSGDIGMFLPMASSVQKNSPLVIVGVNSRTGYSSTGDSWIGTNNLYLSANGFKNFRGCIWNGSYFIAYAADDPVVYRSTDGINWSAAGNTGLSPGILQLVGNNTKMFAMYGGKCAYSTDNGSSWTVNSNLANNTTFSGQYSGSMVIQYGHSFATPMLTVMFPDYSISDGYSEYRLRMWTSPDGITWSSQTPPFTYGTIVGIAYGGTSQNRMVAYGRRSDGAGGYNNYVAYSTNGTAFTAATAADTGSTADSCYFDFYNGRFVLHSQGTNYYTFVDTDGTGTWTNLGSYPSMWGTATYSSSYGFIWSTNYGTTVVYNNDGLTSNFANMNNLKTTSRGVSPTRNMILFGPKVVTFGGVLMSSTNYGSTWSVLSSSATCGTSNANIIVAGGFSGYIYTSTDGNTWTTQTGLRSTSWGTSLGVFDISWNGSVFCAVGENGACATSTNGITWTYQSQLSGIFGSSEAYSITWNGSVFCAVGSGGKVATSPDGSTWTSRGTPGGTTNINSVASSTITGKICFGSSGKILTSSDNGSNWTTTTGLISGTVNAVTHDGKKFVLVDASGRIHTTEDGVTINRLTASISLISGDYIRSILFTGSNYLFGGQNGSMYKSS